jgi:hypothetical protein
MKKYKMNNLYLGMILIVTLLFLGFTFPIEKAGKLQTNGLYVALTKTVELPDQTLEIYNYLRFYDDQTVITQAVSSYNPEAVGNWFKKNYRFERIGEYSLKKGKLAFDVANKGLEDAKLEGERTDKFKGEILENGDLELAITYPSGEVINATFKFVELQSPN